MVTFSFIKPPARGSLRRRRMADALRRLTAALCVGLAVLFGLEAVLAVVETEPMVVAARSIRRFPAHMIQDGSTVAAYVSMGSEIETRPLLRWLLAHGCHVLVPRLGSGLEIGWSVLDSLESLRSMDAVGGANNAGSCSYPSTVHHRPDEPTGAVLPPEALEKADLVIAPALAVDPQGNRLGRGAGWYDRALARRKPACPLIAVCWPWEVLDTDLPAEPHDVPADGVLTPGGYRRLGESGRLS